MSPSSGPSATASDEQLTAALGLRPGMVVQELGWDEDVDDDVRVSFENAIDADLVDGEFGSTVDVVLLWWRQSDGDLVDGLMDALRDLADEGVIWLVCPKVGRPDAVEPVDVAEAAPVAGLTTTSSVSVSQDWMATKLVASGVR